MYKITLISCVRCCFGLVCLICFGFCFVWFGLGFVVVVVVVVVICLGCLSKSAN